MKDEKLLQDELLSDEQLEQVVGGSVGEFARDLQLMNALNLISEAPSVDYLKSNNYENLDTTLDKVNKILKKKCCAKISFSIKGANKYFIYDENGSWKQTDRVSFIEQVCHWADNTGLFDYTDYL